MITAARNRGQVLEVARQSFDERGLAADVREIARLAGVGVATLYRHFPTKDDPAMWRKHTLLVPDGLRTRSAVDGRARHADPVTRG